MNSKTREILAAAGWVACLFVAVTANSGCATTTKPAATAIVESEPVELAVWRSEVRRQAAANDGAARPLALPRLMHPDLPIEPGVPAVPNNSRLGTMGVSLLGSITGVVDTPRSARSGRRSLAPITEGSLDGD